MCILGSPLTQLNIDDLKQLPDSDEEKKYKIKKELSGKIEEVFESGIIVSDAMIYIFCHSSVKTNQIINHIQNMIPEQTHHFRMNRLIKIK